MAMAALAALGVRPAGARGGGEGGELARQPTLLATFAVILSHRISFRISVY